MAHFAGTWLLPIFFALIGTELRHEIKSGTFTKRSDLFLPFTAAAFGVLIPYLIYKAFELLLGLPGSCWGVVVATDLPLALLTLRIFQKSFANRIRPYLLSVAIFDDLISILLIALIFRQNGIHPTVYGFIIGFLIPINLTGKLFSILNRTSNFFIIPFFILATAIEKFAIGFGFTAIAIIIARLLGKPIGIFLGNLISSFVLRRELLVKREVLAVGFLATLGLSVSLLFVEIAGAPDIAVESTFIAIVFALLQILAFKKLALKE